MIEPHVLVQVSNLSKGGCAALHGASKWLLLAMNPGVVEKFVRIVLRNFAIRIGTMEKALIQFSRIQGLLGRNNHIKSESLEIRDLAVKTKQGGPEDTAIDDYKRVDLKDSICFLKLR